MKTFKLIALTATLMIGATAAYASPADAMGGFDALNSLGSARYANVEKVTPAQAMTLKTDTDNASLQHYISSNKAITATLSDQGYAPSDVVGIDTTGSITLYVL